MSQARPRARKQRRTPHLTGGENVTSEYVTHADTITNALTSVLERVWYVLDPALGYIRPHVPTHQLFYSRLSEFRSLVGRRVSKTHPDPLDGYAERWYQGAQLARYQQAVRNIIDGACDITAKIAGFVKYEKVLLARKRLIPRLIQPRSPEFNVCVGRYLRVVEKTIYDIVADIWGGPTILKGYDCFEQGRLIHEAWLSIDDPVAVGLDASRYDQHIHVEALRWEHAIYLMFFSGLDRRELRRFLRMQLLNRGVINCAGGRIRYVVDGGRASGDMNTGLGNSLLMCAMMWAYCRACNIPATSVRLVDNGDDCVVIMSRKCVSRFVSGVRQWFGEMGFDMKVETPVNLLERVVFCQTQPVWDGSRWRMVRDPFRAASKDATLLRRYAPTGMRDYILAISDCGLALCCGIPVMQQYYLASRTFAVDMTVGGKYYPPSGSAFRPRADLASTGMAQLAKGLISEISPITSEARSSFGLAFGLTPAVQIALESQYQSLPPINIVGGGDWPRARF